MSFSAGTPMRTMRFASQTRVRQRGQGIGSFLGKLGGLLYPLLKRGAKLVSPIAKQVAKDTAASMIQSAGNVLQDVTTGKKSLSQSLKDQKNIGISTVKTHVKKGLKDSGKAVLNDIKDQAGLGIPITTKRQRRVDNSLTAQPTRKKKRKKNLNHNKIFSVFE